LYHHDINPRSQVGKKDALRWGLKILNIIEQLKIDCIAVDVIYLHGGWGYFLGGKLHTEIHSVYHRIWVEVIKEEVISANTILVCRGIIYATYVGHFAPVTVGYIIAATHRVKSGVIALVVWVYPIGIYTIIELGMGKKWNVTY
jgi:hypothetical protein|tara:strand:+ start:7067 stop:7498 length:432 start_codon:yes stop_codon:yes gene_type:complete